MFQVNFLKKFHTCLNSQKKSKPFVFTLQVKVFLETPTKGIYNKYAKTSFQFQTKVSTKLLEFLNVNITLPLLKNPLFSNETEINVIFFDQLNNINLFAALPHFFH